MKFSIATIILGLGAVSAAAAATSADPGPSPTASVGCEAHGDHWHCDGPTTAAATVPSAVSSVVSSAAHDDDHDHDHDVHSLAPSPTNSIGCEAHGDHWHCDGPKPTGASNSTGNASISSSPSTDSQTGSAGKTMALSFGGIATVIGSIVLVL